MLSTRRHQRWCLLVFGGPLVGVVNTPYTKTHQRACVLYAECIRKVLSTKRHQCWCLFVFGGPSVSRFERERRSVVVKSPPLLEIEMGAGSWEWEPSISRFEQGRGVPSVLRARKDPTLVSFRVRRVSVGCGRRRARKGTNAGVSSCSACVGEREKDAEHEQTPLKMSLRVRRASGV